MTKQFLLFGTLLCLLAVILGAFGAHALKSALSANELSTYQIANQYHFYHGLGLIAIGLIYNSLNKKSALLMLLKISGWLMLFGVLFFSGSLYLIAGTNIKGLGILTPIGGACLILAWLFAMIAIIKQS